MTGNAQYPCVALLYTPDGERTGRDKLHRVRVLSAIRTLVYAREWHPKGPGSLRLVKVLVEGERSPRDIAAERLDATGGE